MHKIFFRKAAAGGDAIFTFKTKREREREPERSELGWERELGRNGDQGDEG